jgi:hypothetical protein
MPTPIYDHEKAVPIEDSGAVLDGSQKSGVFQEETAHGAAAQGHYATDK